jgi:hypothetical protein
MAIPFKTDHFRFRRQVELETEIRAKPLFRKVDAWTGAEWSQRELKLKMAGGFPVPPGAMHAIDEATLTLKTVARLPYDLKVLLARERDATWWCLAHWEGNQLTFKLTPKLFQECSVTGLVYHLAFAAFLAFQPVHCYLHHLLCYRPPFPLDDRLNVLELLRLGRYAAGCFALVCCGSLDTARREGFHRYTDLKLEPQAMDFDQLAGHYLKTGETNLADILNEPTHQLGYLPIEPLILKRFQETETCRACLGEEGGVPREQFESEVLELDREAYPRLKELPAGHKEFIGMAKLLAAYFVLEAGGLVTQAREANLLDFFDLEPKHLEDIAKQFSWQRTEESNTERVLENLLTGRDKHLAHLHSVDILKTAFLFAAQAHDGKFPKRLRPAFIKLGTLCQLVECEVIAIYECVLEPKPEEQERGE